MAGYNGVHHVLFPCLRIDEPPIHVLQDGHNALKPNPGYLHNPPPPHITAPEAWTVAGQRLKQETWAAMAWMLWRERNRRLFQGQRSNIRSLLIEATSYIKHWALCGPALRRQANGTTIRIALEEL
jgi:hypothetical protein